MNGVINVETAKKLKSLEQKSLFYWYKGSMSGHSWQIIDIRIYLANQNLIKQEIGAEVCSAFTIEEMNKFIPKEFSFSGPDWHDGEVTNWSSGELFLDEDESRQVRILIDGETETESKGNLLAYLIEKEMI
jgi:hypothetical protein